LTEAFVQGAAARQEESAAPPGPASRPRGPWRQALSQIARDRVAMGSVVVLLLIVVACLMAPLYARYIAHTNPFQSNILGTTIVNGKSVQVLQPDTQGLGLGSAPIGPTWHGNYFLGADQEGRDVMARLLYGGRTTLLIGTASAAVCCIVAAVLGLIAGYFGGAVDWILSRLFDLVWAFPVYLLAISLAVVLLTSGIHLGPIQVGPGSLLVPILIIALIYIPYVARPLRGQVLSLKEREFIQAAVGVGVADLRIIRKEVLPNILPAIIVYFPLMVALGMLTESALSFLSIGVQPPQASWGTIINDGMSLLYNRPAVAIAPGVLLVITTVALNLLGDSVRDALDPRVRLRGSV
jgi:peptide/nickel transport system permease protein